jgi:hypothetical protein
VAFDFADVGRVELHCSPENSPSVRIAEKLGFRLQRVIPAHSQDSEGMVRDLMVWAIDAAGFAVTPWATLPVKAFDASDARLTDRRSGLASPAGS